MTSPDKALEYLLFGFIPGAEQDNVDLDTTLDQGFGGHLVSRDVLLAGRSHLAALLAEGLAADELHYRAMPMCGVPGGRDIEAFLHYVLLRIDEVLASGVDTLNVPWRRTPANGLSPLHRGRFVDDEAATAACRQVLARHEARVRAWASDPAGTPRLHLVADLSQVDDPGGVADLAGQADPVGWVTATDELGAVVADPRPTAQVVVLLGHDPTPGSPLFEVLTAYPDLEVDVDVRARYPDLCTLFGGFFGQERAAIDGQILWNAEYRLHELTGVEVVGRMADQLQRLLSDLPPDSEPDPDLRRLVHSLGACTQPTVGVRAWLEGLHRRMVHLDWGPGCLAVVRGTQAGPRRG